ncbi:VWA domain-containing protein [Candidatus Gracilibacteria bacterium]|nr:VWA domain-containing protein [Candidatus Gracilibacteria bacterium]
MRQKNKSALKINFTSDLQKVFGRNNYTFYIKLLLIFLIFGVFILLLSDPHKANIKQNISKNGIDIVLALDISKSMEATDLEPNRLEKAKETIIGFIEKQKTNRVGLIVFAGKPISSVPLTFDYNILSETLENLSTDTLNQNVNGLDGTAIGDSLLMSKNLFGTGAREKTIILLTDGDANRGVDPVITSKLLAEEKIKIYTIGIGSTKGGFIEVQQGSFRQQMKIPPLNATSLKEIAKNTSGFFFRATDNATLEKIFDKLEELEKNDIEVNIVKNFNDYYPPFVYTLLALIIGLLILEIRRPKTH